MTLEEDYAALSAAMGTSSFGQSTEPTPAFDPYELQRLQQQLSLGDQKQQRLEARALEKSKKLRTDDQDYGHDNILTRGAKGLFNAFADHDNQLAVNHEGKRYNTENTIFNESGEEDLNKMWNSYGNDPNGDKVMYYLKRPDGVNEDGTTKYMYKPGVADVSAADRYYGQLKEDGWQLIAEKRFNAASTFEKETHGSQAARDARSFDYGTYDYGDSGFADAEKEGRSYSTFGAGTSELYDKDILGLDTGTEEEYAQNKASSIGKMNQAWDEPYQRNDMFESVDAFQAAGQTLAGKLVKGVGSFQQAIFDPEAEGDGAIESWGKKLMKDANKDWGYNDKTMTDGAAQMRSGLREGNPLDVLVGMFKAAPQAVAGSLPESAAYMGTGTLGLGARLAGLAAINTNDILDAREEANGGKKATAEEIAAVGFAEMFAVGLDAGAFRFITKGLPGIGIKAEGSKAVSMNDMMGMVSDSTKLELLKVLGRSATRGSGAFATEAGQETATEVIRMLAETLGTTKYGDEAMAIIQSEEGLGRLSNAFLLGGAGGVGFGAPRNIKKTVQEARRAVHETSILKDGIAAGKGAESIEDAVTKSEYADSKSVNIEEAFNNVEAARSSVSSAKNIDEMSDAINNSNIELTVKNTIASVVNGYMKDGKLKPGVDFDMVKNQIENNLHEVKRGIAVDNKATLNAKAGLQTDLNEGNLGEAVSSNANKVHEMNTKKTDLEESIKEAEAEFLDASSDYADSKTDTSGSIDPVEAKQKYEQSLEKFTAAQSELETLNAEIAEEVKSNTDGYTEAKKAAEEAKSNADEAIDTLEKISKTKDIEKLKKTLAENETKLESVRKQKDAVNKTEEKAPFVKQINGMLKAKKAMEARIKDLDKNAEIIETRTELDANKAEIEANEFVKKKSEENLANQTNNRIGKKNKKKARAARKTAIEAIAELTEKAKTLTAKFDNLTDAEKANAPLVKKMQTSLKSINNQMKKAQAFKDKISKEIDADEVAEVEAEYAEGERITKEAKDKLKAKEESVEKEAVKKARAEKKKAQRIAKKAAQKKENLVKDVDVTKDEVADQVQEAKDTAAEIGKNIDKTKKKSGVVRSIVKAIVTNLPGGKGLKVNNQGFHAKIKKLSTAALRELSKPEVIAELEQSLIGENGYQPISKAMIEKAIASEVKRRKISNSFFNVGYDVKLNEAEQTSSIRMGLGLEKVSRTYSQLTHESAVDLSDAEYAKIGNEYVEGVQEALASLDRMSTPDLRKLMEGTYVEGLNTQEFFLAKINQLPRTGQEDIDVKIQETINNIGERANRVSTDTGIKDFVFKIAKSNVTSDPKEITAALKAVKELEARGVFTTEQAKSFTKQIKDVKVRSLAKNIDIMQQREQNDLMAVDKIDESIDNDQSLDTKSKKKLRALPANMKIQFMNIMGSVSQEALDVLAFHGIDTSSISFDGKEGTIRIPIGEGC